MSFLGMYWGEENNPHKKPADDEPRSERRRLRTSDVSYGHTPDKHRKPSRGYENKPIDVRRSGGRYRIIDGSARLQAAIERGDSHIDAEVWE